MTIQCSNCGKWEGFRYSQKRVERLAKEGWGSFGGALYCPECTATWRERNDKPLAPNHNTVAVIEELRQRR